MDWTHFSRQQRLFETTLGPRAGKKGRLPTPGHPPPLSGVPGPRMHAGACVAQSTAAWSESRSKRWMSGSQMWPSCSGQRAQPPPEQMWRPFCLPPPSLSHRLSESTSGEISQPGPPKDSFPYGSPPLPRGSRGVGTGPPHIHRCPRSAGACTLLVHRPSDWMACRAGR